LLAELLSAAVPHWRFFYSKTEDFNALESIWKSGLASDATHKEFAQPERRAIVAMNQSIIERLRHIKHPSGDLIPIYRRPTWE
jgi:hypothetical protein